MSLSNNQLETRIVTVEKMLNNIQVAINALATKAQLTQLSFLRQNEIYKLQQNVTYLNTMLFANQYVTSVFNAQLSVNIVHNFNEYPVVQVCDHTGAVLIPQSIVNNSLNDFTVNFSEPTSGVIIATLGFVNPFTSA